MRTHADLEHAVLRLLRRLRDLNLEARGIALDGGRTVALEGCDSFDAPVEGGVRYRLAGLGPGEAQLEIGWDERGLLARVVPGGPARRFALEVDPEGRLISRALGARVDAARAGARHLEHVLRRLVRAATR